MITEYPIVTPLAYEGQLFGADRKSRPMQVAQIAEVQELTADGGAATDDLVITAVDDYTGQVHQVTATGSATEATMLANVLAAVRGYGVFNNLFSVADGGTGADVVVDFTARHRNRSYTMSATGGPSGTNAFVVTTAAGATGLEMGRFVKKGADDDSIVALAAGDTVGDIVGALRRTDANHFHSLENDRGSSVVDRLPVGTHLSVVYEGLMFIRPETALVAEGPIFCRINGSGRLGGFRNDADGGDAIDVSSICSVRKSAAADGLALIRIDL